jgi:hypothetical protein
LLTLCCVFFQAEEYRNRLLQDHIAHRQSQETVISDLGSRLEVLSRDNGRLNDEILELVEIRELAKKGGFWSISVTIDLLGFFLTF